MQCEALELVNDTFTLATLEDERKIILKINQCLCYSDPHATEALLQPHQVRHHGVIVHDVSCKHKSVTRENGTQCMKIDDHTLPLMFDGFKIYCVIEKLEPSDLSGKYPIYEITSSQPYKPQRRHYSRRLKKTPTTVEKWRANLGFLTHEKTKQTLHHTTQYIKTLQAET